MIGRHHRHNGHEFDGDSIDLYLLVFGVEELGGSRVPSFIRILIQQLFSAHFVPGTILRADG